MQCCKDHGVCKVNRRLGGAVEPGNNASTLQLEEQEDTKNSKVIVDYKQDVDFESHSGRREDRL